MLKGKEVISDPQKQYEIARGIHVLQHGGINKTTAIIAEKYHWVRIKETVSLVIKNCGECKELGKAPVVKPDYQAQLARQSPPKSQDVTDANILSLPEQQQLDHHRDIHQHHDRQSQPSHLQHDFQQIQHHHDHTSTSVSPQVLNRRLPSHSPHLHSNPIVHLKQHQPPISQMQLHHAETRTQSQAQAQAQAQAHSHSPSHRHSATDYLQIDPQIMDYTHTSHSPHPHFDAHHEHDTDSFQAMLENRDVDVDVDADGGGGTGVDGDIDDMLVDQDEVEVEHIGDIGTVEHNNTGDDINTDETMSDSMGNPRHKSHDDVMATARLAQGMISRGVMDRNEG